MAVVVMLVACLVTLVLTGASAVLYFQVKDGDNRQAAIAGVAAIYILIIIGLAFVMYGKI